MANRFNYNGFITTADKLITRYGNACTLVSIVKGTRNTTTGLITETRTSITIQAYFYDDNRKFQEGTQIEKADKMALISVLNQSVPPKKNDEIVTSDSFRYSIQNLEVIEPSGRDIVWKVELKA